jgi:hypothetical protein
MKKKKQRKKMREQTTQELAKEIKPSLQLIWISSESELPRSWRQKIKKKFKKKLNDQIRLGGAPANMYKPNHTYKVKGERSLFFFFFFFLLLVFLSSLVPPLPFQYPPSYLFSL